jgi:MFS family permease
METLHINSKTYNWLYAGFALPNIVATIILGFLIDFLGVRTGIIALSLGVVVFQSIVALGGAVKSFPCMLTGRILFGIASESLVTAQAAFVSLWFVGQELSFALGLAITLPELGNALNSFVTPLVYEKT